MLKSIAIKPVVTASPRMAVAEAAKAMRSKHFKGRWSMGSRARRS